MFKKAFFVFSLLFIVLTANYIKQNNLGWLILDDRPSFKKIVFNKPIIKDELIRQEFQSKSQNLGMVGIRFETFNRLNDDWLKFSIKEKNASDWYYSADYKTDQFQPKKIFPFGFPVIKDSGGKTYQIEVASLQGTASNSVGISDLGVNFIARHVYSKKILKEPIDLAKFLAQKIKNLSQYPGFKQNIFIYSLPVIFLSILYFTNYSFFLSLSLTVITIFWDLFLYSKTNDYIFISVFILWFLVFKKHRLSPKISVYFSLFVFPLIPISVLMKNYLWVEKSTSWVILYAIFSLFYQVKEIVQGRYSKKGLRYFIKKLPLNNGIDRSKHKNLSVINPASFFSLLRLWLKTIPGFVIKINMYFFTFKFPLKHLFSLANLLLFWIIIRKTATYIKFYFHFFPNHQFYQFMQKTGWLLLLYALIILIIGLMVRYLLRFKKTSFIIFISLIFCLWGFAQIFNRTTSSFSSDVFIWEVRSPKGTLWDEIAIKGQNFKDMPFQGEVSVAGVKHRVLSWSNTRITFQAEPGKTRSGPVQVTDINGKKSNIVYFRFYDFFTGEIIE